MRYSFGENVMAEDNVTVTQEAVSLDQFAKTIPLQTDNPYKDYA